VAFAGVTRVVSAATSSLWVLVAARFMSVEDFATFALCAALAVVFVALADLGVTTMMASAMVDEPRAGRRILRAAMRVRLAAAAFAVPAFLLAFAVSSDVAMWPAIVMCVSVVATLLHTPCGMALRVVGKARTEAWWDLISRMLVLGFGALWLANGGGVVAAVAMYALADLVMLLAVWWAAARGVGDDDADVTVPVFHLRRFVVVAITVSLATV
jgi:O-antigen/teichoic acid export membrane protein